MKDGSLEHSGSISTVGEGAHGLLTINGAVIDGDGTIVTEGSGASGVHSYGENKTIEHRGKIKVAGTNAKGIYLSSHGTVNISGTVSATGEATQAIASGGNYAQTLNLLSGTKIVGRIDLGNAADTFMMSGGTGNVDLGAGANTATVTGGAINGLFDIGGATADAIINPLASNTVRFLNPGNRIGVERG